MDNTVIEIHDLTVAYDKKPVLWNIDFSVPEGKLVGIIGPNGAGKSTLLKSIMNLIQPNSGFVKTWDKAVKDCKTRIAYVPQRESVDWDFPASVMDIALMGRFPHKGIISRFNKKDKEMAFNALKKVGMHELADRQISQLSGGQQQRAFLARAITQDADLYLMDEPFAGVDAGTEKEIVQLLKDLNQKGKTIVVVHHDLQSVQEYFNYLIMINTTLVAAGNTEDVFIPENLKNTYGGKMSIINQIGHLIQEKSFPIRKG